MISISPLLWLIAHPSGHATLSKRCINVDATSRRCIEVNATLYKPHELAGQLTSRYTHNVEITSFGRRSELIRYGDVETTLLRRCVITRMQH